MKVLFLGGDDWANMANRIARSLQATGAAEARVWTLNRHPYGYPEDHTGPSPSAEIRDFAQRAEWIIAAGDGEYGVLDRMLAALGRPPAKRGCIHAGSNFRAQAARYRMLDRAFGFRFRLVGCDSVRLDPDLRPFIPPADTVSGTLIPAKPQPTVAHAPSKRNTKGTATILKAVPGVVLLEGLPYAAMRAARARHEVLIDQLAPNVGGFGVTAVEAMADGCAVLADLRHCGPAWTFIEPPPILDVRTGADLEKTVPSLLSDAARLEEVRAASLAWAKRHASDQGISDFWISTLDASK